MPIIEFLVYDGFDADLDAIAIYRRIKTLPDLVKPAVYAILTLLRGCRTIILVNYTGILIPFSVFMDSTPPADPTWGLNKLKITFPTLCSSYKEPGPYSAPPVASSYINLKLFQQFLPNIKLPRLSPSPEISSRSTEPIM